MTEAGRGTPYIGACEGRKNMIRENQRLFNQLHVLSDGMLIYPMFPLAYWIRFYVLPNAGSSMPLSSYLKLGIFYTVFQLFTFAVFGLYQSFRTRRLRVEIRRLLEAIFLNMVLLVSGLYLFHDMFYSRLTLAFFCCLTAGVLGAKRFILRRTLRWIRGKDMNQKHVIVLGNGRLARRYLQEIRRDQGFGYRAIGYVAEKEGAELGDLTYLGDYGALERFIEKYRPDEVVSAIEKEDFHRTAKIVEVCEKTGVRLAIIPFYADFMPPHPQFDDLNGIPLMNIRYIPLDNWGNAFCKRTMDIVGSALLLVLTSPLMLACAIGVRLSSPGPIIFQQERVGRNKQLFYMYKFRSMRLNDAEDTGWSGTKDDRRTRFGSFMRKCSLDELPQFWNVLKGDMSLVGPRPELPFYVEKFKKDVPLYMVKHQVRPGITGWAQVNDFRGDTSIRARVEHDVYYIEHWSVSFDIKILLMTVFGGKFINEEQL